jgi:hypothetical protein
MRVLASSEVVEKAEGVAQRILDAYFEPDKSFAELQSMVKDHAIDLLYDFSEACRTEQDFSTSSWVKRLATPALSRRDGRGLTSKTY